MSHQALKSTSRQFWGKQFMVASSQVLLTHLETLQCRELYHAIWNYWVKKIAMVSSFVCNASRLFVLSSWHLVEWGEGRRRGGGGEEAGVGGARGGITTPASQTCPACHFGTSELGFLRKWAINISWSIFLNRSRQEVKHWGQLKELLRHWNRSVIS